MSQSVEKLKELLFDSEAETLSRLARRIEALSLDNRDLRDELLQLLSELEARDATERAALAQRIEAIHARAGSDEHMARSVAAVIDRAITEAEQSRHQELASAVAPVIVRTVKTEISNSRDELVEALYPMTGKMVKAYVASAMRDLVDQINRRVEQNALMLRLKSWTTGQSVADLALADSQRLSVGELLLIRRATGELIGKWPDRTTGNYDHVFGGVLSAINTFAAEALEGGESTLRKIDLGDSHVFLRASPTFLLAARCQGTPTASIETIIDEEFERTVERLIGAASTGETEIRSGLDQSAQSLGDRIARQHAALAAPAFGVSPFKLLAWLIGLPLLVGISWWLYVETVTRRVETIAADVIRNSPEIQGYPSTLDVGRLGRSLRLTGLAPDAAAADAVTRRLETALPGTRIDSRLAAVPNGGASALPEIAALRSELAIVKADVPRQLALRDLARARLNLSSAEAELAALGQQLAASTPAKAHQGLEALRGQFVTTRERLVAHEAALARSAPAAKDGEAIRADLDRRTSELGARTHELVRELGGVAASRAPGPAKAASDGYAGAAERLAQELQNTTMSLVALVQTVATRAAFPRIPEPPPAVSIPEATPLDKLRAFMRTNAVFFANRTDYRDDVLAEATLDRLAELARSADVLVRIVGYTDERGSNNRNLRLSLDRAERIKAGLIARGMAPDRLVAVGRQDARDLSPQTGPTSPNRRVEFEIGFAGEAAR